MTVSIKDKIEYEQELAGWESLFIRMKILIDEVSQESEKEEQKKLMDSFWENKKKLLKRLYFEE